MSSYKAAFLIPSNAKKTLGDSGWIFDSEDRIPSEVLDIIKNAFHLKENKKYLGIVSYEGDGIKASVVYDENELIEQIAIQLWTKSIDELTLIYHTEQFKLVELFVP